eukprot:8150520-Pyramimonas_sp.AAC.1
MIAKIFRGSKKREGPNSVSSQLWPPEAPNGHPGTPRDVQRRDGLYIPRRQPLEGGATFAREARLRMQG